VIAGVVLAAGAASRFGEPKQRLLLPRVLARLDDTPLDEVVVVSGAYELDAGAARLVACPEWERGPGASLRCGLAALSPDTEAAVVCLADGPNLAPAAVERVVNAWRAEGMRTLPATLVPCDDLGSPGDVDSPEDRP
jgi:molybdenum cofactor cytidylyltransferase